MFIANIKSLTFFIRMFSIQLMYSMESIPSQLYEI